MRRWLALLLLTLLPLQFSWAAVAGYCGHEAAPSQSQHLGHHVHQHQHQHQHQHRAAGGSADPEAHPSNPPDSPADQAAEAGHNNGETRQLAAGPDLDCGPCHGLGLGLHAPRISLDATLATQAPAEALSPALPLVAPTPPERPQWARPA